jgi:DNA repair photolyase
MKSTIVNVPSIKDPIKKSPGFAKKELADYKLDIMGRCQFQCSYCSSDHSNYLRINQERFADLTGEQTGVRRLHTADSTITFRWSDFETCLNEQLRPKPSGLFLSERWGYGKTLVFSQLTDAFSPWAVAEGLTRRTLDKVLDRTGFRIRVLTKSATVGSPHWVDYFAQHPMRFVVGLSIGTLDNEWAREIEIGTSSPRARVDALHALQNAGIPTYGMLCPVFPDVLDGDGVIRLVEAIRPARCETVWSEPFNDRNNWRAVANGYQHGSPAHKRMVSLFSGLDRVLRWSDYAEELYARVHAALGADVHKHRYLLYQDTMTADARERMRGKQGVLFQSDEGKKHLPMAEDA